MGSLHMLAHAWKETLWPWWIHDEKQIMHLLEKQTREVVSIVVVSHVPGRPGVKMGQNWSPYRKGNERVLNKCERIRKT